MDLMSSSFGDGFLLWNGPWPDSRGLNYFPHNEGGSIMGYLNVKLICMDSFIMSPCPTRAHHTYITFLFTLGRPSIKLVHEVVNIPSSTSLKNCLSNLYAP